jgi:hypothetical protein
MRNNYKQLTIEDHKAIANTINQIIYNIQITLVEKLLFSHCQSDVVRKNLDKTWDNLIKLNRLLRIEFNNDYPNKSNYYSEK